MAGVHAGVDDADAHHLRPLVDAVSAVGVDHLHAPQQGVERVAGDRPHVPGAGVAGGALGQVLLLHDVEVPGGQVTDTAVHGDALHAVDRGAVDAEPGVARRDADQSDGPVHGGDLGPRGTQGPHRRTRGGAVVEQHQVVVVRPWRGPCRDLRAGQADRAGQTGRHECHGGGRGPTPLEVHAASRYWQRCPPSQAVIDCRFPSEQTEDRNGRGAGNYPI